MHARRYVAQDNPSVRTLSATMRADQHTDPGGIDVTDLAQVDDEVTFTAVNGVVQYSARVGGRGGLQRAGDDDEVAGCVRLRVHVPTSVGRSIAGLSSPGPRHWRPGDRRVTVSESVTAVTQTRGSPKCPLYLVNCRKCPALRCVRRQR